MVCPLCGAGATFICDCGTNGCANGHVWYMSHDGWAVVGHSPTCGDSSGDEAEDDGVEIETVSESDDD